ncbi:MAG: hypothetical protein MJE68_14335 [Proteobacteria bacterium]|nr:hypothetical protein [Pseudomonadota bacterium]
MKSANGRCSLATGAVMGYSTGSHSTRCAELLGPPGDRLSCPTRGASALINLWAT